jgi:hypothetical protein
LGQSIDRCGIIENTMYQQSTAVMGSSVTADPPRGEHKKPGAVSRPGTLREFQFSEYYDS